MRKATATPRTPRKNHTPISKEVYMNGAKVSFFGNLTQDPEINYGSESGKPYTKARIAVNTFMGEDKEVQTDFYSLTWFFNAEQVANRFEKGDRLYIEGHFRPEYYVAHNGENRMSLGVIVRDHNFISKPKGRTQPEDQDHNMGTSAEPTDIPTQDPDEEY